MSDKFSQILSRLEERWNQPLPVPARRLLRLSLARELSRATHTLRSEFMAMELQDEAEKLARQENFLLALLKRGTPIEEMSLRELGQGDLAKFEGTQGNSSPPELELPA